MKAEYGDTFSVDTGKFTGRSPSDKWIVKNIGSESDENIWCVPCALWLPPHPSPRWRRSPAAHRRLRAGPLRVQVGRGEPADLPGGLR
jgi:hypothetical protein